MIGFLLGGALLGSALAAVPVWLHIRSQRRQIAVEVPSLYLFNFQQARSSSRRPEHLLLLVARFCFPVLLAFLVAQTFWTSEEELDLPAMPGELPPPCTLGVVLDDSLASLVGPPGATRLDRSRDWLLAQFDRLPAHATVVLCPSTYPTPLPAMSLDQARTALAEWRSLPQPGDAAAAVAALSENLKGETGAIAVLAPRDAELWPATAQLPPGRYQLIDCSLVTAPVRLDGSDWELRDDQHWSVRLLVQGEPEGIAGRVLRLTSQTSEERELTLSLADAVAGRVQVQLPATETEQGWSARIVADADHPWLHWYWHLPAKTSIDERPWAIAAADSSDRQLLRAALTSIASHRELVDLSQRGPADWPAVGGGLILGPLPAEADAWVEQQCREHDAQFVLLPDRRQGAQAAAAGIAWGTPNVRYLRGFGSLLDSPGLPPWAQLPPHCRDGLAGVNVPDYFPPRGVGCQTIWRSPSGDPVLLARRIAAGTCWALALTPALRRGNAVTHPSWPLTIAALLQPQEQTEDGSHRTATVGEQRSLAQWLARPMAAGSWQAPGGASRKMRWESDGSQARVRLDVAGCYAFASDGATQYRAANDPRHHGAAPRPPEHFAAPAWHLGSLDDPLPSTELYRVIGEPERVFERSYDLAPLLVRILTIWVAVESFALWLAWRRPVR